MSQLVTACAAIAQRYLQPVFKLYWMLTGWIPRRLPESLEEYDQMKAVLLNYFGLEDRSDVWATIAGQICGTPVTKMHRSYRSLAIAGKRLQINAVAHSEKIARYAEIQAKINEKSLKVVDEPNATDVQSGTPDLQ